MVPVLLAFGLDEFSVSSPSILRTRKVISKWTMDEAKKLADTVLGFKTANEVKAALQAAAK